MLAEPLLADVHQVFAREGGTTYDAVGHNVGSVVTSLPGGARHESVKWGTAVRDCREGPLGMLTLPHQTATGLAVNRLRAVAEST